MCCPLKLTATNIHLKYSEHTRFHTLNHRVSINLFLLYPKWRTSRNDSGLRIGITSRLSLEIRLFRLFVYS